MFRRCLDLRFCAGRRPVDRLAGAVLVPTCQIAHNQVLPGKYNTKVASWASPGPIRPCTTDHTDIPKPVYGIHTVPAYIIVFPSAYEIHRNPYGARTWTLRNPSGYAYGILRSCGQRICRESIERPYACNQNIAFGWCYRDFQRATCPYGSFKDLDLIDNRCISQVFHWPKNLKLS